jgi:hypothetical protein
VAAIERFQKLWSGWRKTGSQRRSNRDVNAEGGMRLDSLFFRFQKFTVARSAGIIR